MNLEFLRRTSKNMNLLEDPCASAFFTFKESIVYFCAIKIQRTRRDFYPKLIKDLKTLIAHIDPQSFELLTKVLCRSQKPTNLSRTLSVVKVAKRLHPKGFELLQIGNDLNFEILRTAYRQAAFKYHPDVGGDDESMKAVNEAYTQFHNLVSETLLLEETSENRYGYLLEQLGFDSHGKAEDWLVAAHVLLLEIYLDSLALDLALGEFEIIEVRLSGAGNQSVKNALLDNYIRLARKLYAWGKTDKARESLSASRRLYKELEELGSGCIEHFLYRQENCLKGKPPRFLLNHPIQSENALRIGLIDQRRYNDAQKKFVSANRFLADKKRILQDFLSKIGFQDLPSDTEFRSNRKPSNLVPEPGYFELILGELSTDQQDEYFLAFSRQSDLGFVTKYQWVRMASSLRSIVWCYKALDIGHLIAELCVLEQVQKPKSSALLVIQEMLKVVVWLDALNEDERNRRFSILRVLDEVAEGDDKKRVVTIALSHQRPLFTVEPSVRYCRLLKVPLEELTDIKSRDPNSYSDYYALHSPDKFLKVRWRLKRKKHAGDG